MTQGSMQLPTVSPLPGTSAVPDINTLGQILATLNAGASSPTTGTSGLPSLAGILWHDTTANQLKIRDQADTTWMVIAALNETSKLWEPWGATQTQGDYSSQLINSAYFTQNLPGGFVNKFRNPGFDVAQRGTSGTTSSSTGVYTLDGWIVGSDGTHTISWAQSYQNNVGLNAGGNFLKITGASSVTDTFIKQRIESSVSSQIANQTVTIQFLINNNLVSGSITPTLTVKHAASSDNWSSPVTDVSGVTLQTVTNGTAGIVSYTYACPANAVFGIEVTLDFGSALNNGSSFIFVGRADIRATPGVTTAAQNNNPPPVELRPISIETLFCRRYLPAFNPISATSPMTIAQATSSTTALVVIAFDVPARIAPTGVTVSSVSHFAQLDSTGSLHTCTGVAFGDALFNSCRLASTVASGLAAGNASAFYSQSASAQLLFTGAEL